MKPSTPSQNGEFESDRTSQPWATACIQVPVFERNAPDQNNLKLRWRSARNISLTPRSGRSSSCCRVDMNNLNNIRAAVAPTFGSRECDGSTCFSNERLVFVRVLSWCSYSSQQTTTSEKMEPGKTIHESTRNMFSCLVRVVSWTFLLRRKTTQSQHRDKRFIGIEERACFNYGSVHRRFRSLGL